MSDIHCVLSREEGGGFTGKMSSYYSTIMIVTFLSLIGNIPTYDLIKVFIVSATNETNPKIKIKRCFDSYRIRFKILLFRLKIFIKIGD